MRDGAATSASARLHASPHEPRSVDPSKIARVSLAAVGEPGAKPLRGVAPSQLSKSLPQRSQLVHQLGSGACPDIRRSNRPYATSFSSRSLFPESMRPPKPNSVEPPWYGTRMPGGVGGVASRGVPLSRSYVDSCHSRTPQGGRACQAYFRAMTKRLQRLYHQDGG